MLPWKFRRISDKLEKSESASFSPRTVGSKPASVRAVDTSDLLKSSSALFEIAFNRVLRRCEKAARISLNISVSSEVFTGDSERISRRMTEL